MPHRDPHTGQFVSNGSGGNFDGSWLEEVYTGQGAYVDVEQLTFHVDQLTDTNGETNDREDNTVLELLDFNDILDRREEMCDILYMDVGLTVGAHLADDNVTVTPRSVVGGALLHESEDPAPLDITELDPYGAGDFALAETDDTLDAIGRRLTGHASPGFEDGANSAGGGASATTDRWSGWGHQLTGNATFSERDELFATVELNQHRETKGWLQLSGQMMVGLFELEEQRVRR